MVGFEGTSVTPELRKLIQREGVAGVILFKRNIESLQQVAELNRELRSLAGERPFLIAVDQEGGRVSRLPEPFIKLPPMRQLGPLDTAHTRAIAEVVALELLGLGFNLNFAPVADVDSNPQNPVIGDRSFSPDPEVVARHAMAYVDGLQGAGCAACLKHFPGHGDTKLDSHLALPTVEHNPERLREIELFPFVAALTQRDFARSPSFFEPPYPPATIMTAHVYFPALDDAVPATLSRKIVTGLLRESCDYRGIIVSDDLEMKALYDAIDGKAVCRDVEEAAVRSVAAGCDMLLVCREEEWQWRALEALRKALRDGVLDDAQVRASNERVEFVSQRFNPPPVMRWVHTSQREAVLAALEEALRLRREEGVA